MITQYMRSSMKVRTSYWLYLTQSDNDNRVYEIRHEGEHLTLAHLTQSDSDNPVYGELA